MPHIKVSLSANVARPGRLKPLLADLASNLGQAATVDCSAVKAYLIIHEHFALNPEGPPGFAHVEVALLQGRPVELKTEIAKSMRDILVREFSEKFENGELAITVEIREMDPDTYLK
jgi:5-carboxymethyl-2-hydroxymuconate isomerase